MVSMAAQELMELEVTLALLVYLVNVEMQALLVEMELPEQMEIQDVTEHLV